MDEDLVNKIGKAVDSILAEHGKTLEEITVAQEWVTQLIEVRLVVREFSHKENIHREM